MVANLRPCPFCGSTVRKRTTRVFHPEHPTVAGVRVDLLNSEFFLVDCGGCGSAFKDPAIPEPILQAAYDLASGAHWGEGADDLGSRNLAPLVRAIAQYLPNDYARTVLDVGCGSGAVMDILCPEWNRSGIEPNPSAAAIASSRRVRILGPNIESIPRSDVTFSLVMALDVLEHINEPLTFLRFLAEVTEPGGIVLIVTGDRAALSWRLEKGRYWYCSLVEHVNFVSDQSLTQLALEVGLVSLECEQISHVRSSLLGKVKEASKNLGYILLCEIARVSPKLAYAPVVTRRAPTWMTAKDHQMHVFRRTP